MKKYKNIEKCWKNKLNKKRKRLASMEKLDNKIRKFDRELY